MSYQVTLHKCGNCIFGHTPPQDMTQRLCKGAPPTPILWPVGQGRAELQFHYPLMDANTPACALHKSKIVVDHINGKLVE